MDVTQCTARLEDKETRCTSQSANASVYCLAHMHERDRLVKEYKEASSRGNSLRGSAVISKRQLKALRTPAEFEEAVRATEAYREAVQDEARRRATHTKRFYWNDPYDSSDGHHVRVQRLLERIETCDAFLAHLRKDPQSTERTNPRRQVRETGKADRRIAEERRLAETRTRRRVRENARRDETVALERADAETMRRARETWEGENQRRAEEEGEMARKRQRWVEEEREMQRKRQRWAQEERALRDREARRRQADRSLHLAREGCITIVRLVLYAAVAYGIYGGITRIYRWLRTLLVGTTGLPPDKLKPFPFNVDCSRITFTARMEAICKAICERIPGVANTRPVSNTVISRTQRFIEGAAQVSGEWLSTRVNTVRGALSQEAPRVSENRPIAETVDTIQTVARNVAANLGKWVQDGVRNDDLHDILRSLGLRRD